MQPEEPKRVMMEIYIILEDFLVMMLDAYGRKV